MSLSKHEHCEEQMSAPPKMRRDEKSMPVDRTLEILARGFCGRLATIGADGYPYCVPLLYVWMDGEIYVHNTSARGHLRANAEHEARVCFEMDEPGDVFPYGRFECDTSVAFKSVIAFGKIRIIDDRATKQRFFEALMQKYARRGPGRPEGFFPRLDGITLYAITVERMTGKETPLPSSAQQWPALDQTKSPNARAPQRQGSKG
jgi:nitroimidazol reductase NimA-like FMN-containing flavoprotein (pyridoxamine 5'-phosphate oxidase superfamily)